jgi:histidyl-tRNA synthetase
VIRIVRGVYESYGFEPLSTPAIEFQGVLFKEKSDTAKQYFEVAIRRLGGVIDLTKGRRGQRLGLRYDHTVPLARVVADYEGRLTLPYKRYAIGPVWRAEKPQKDRGREFTQVDFDSVGVSSLSTDAEVAAVLCSAADAVGLRDYTAIFNHRVLLDGIALWVGAQTSDQVTEVIRSLDKLGKTEFGDSPKNLAQAGLDPEAIDRFSGIASELSGLGGSNSEVVAFLRRTFQNEQAQEGLDEICRLLELAAAYNHVASRLVVRPTLARGFDYYTGPVFEMVSARSKSSFAGGGRFDHLIEALGGRDLPATGASFGLERFADLVRSEGNLSVDSTNIQVFVTLVNQEPGLVEASIKVAQELRAAGFSVELYGGEEPLARQLTIADRRQVPVVVILGPSELSSDTVTVKDMRAEMVVKDRMTNQKTVSRSQLTSIVGEMLSG